MKLDQHYSGPTRPNKFRSRAAAAGAFVVASIATLLPLSVSAEVASTIKMKVLIVTTDDQEPSVLGMRATLDQVNVPYDVVNTVQTPLTAATLSDGHGNGNYQAIMLSTGNMAYFDSTSLTWKSAFAPDQWNALYAYEAAFRVRQVTLYTYPSASPDPYYCLSPSNVQGVSTDTQPVVVTLTQKGRPVFNYLKPTALIGISQAWTYLAQPDPAAPRNAFAALVVTASGNPIVSTCAYSDGRQNLAVTADNNPELIHTLALNYGILNWATKGVFIGERHVYMVAQPDDIMIADELWDPITRTTGTTEYRMTGYDYRKLVAWQNRIQNQDVHNAAVTLEMPFNGDGVSGGYSDGSLGNAILNNPGAFKWISHTYDHENLDAIVDPQATSELQLNDDVARKLRLNRYSRDSMVQPDISGLQNPYFLTAASRFGIRNLLCDTSHTDCPATQNVGYYISDSSPAPGGWIPHGAEPILVIPRFPTNLYYNVSTPTEWVSEYNYFYGPGGTNPYFNTPQTYAQMIDTEANTWLRHMLKYQINGMMFHQANLRAYDGTNSMLGDLMKATLLKYNALMTLPIKSPSQHDQAASMRTRMSVNSSGLAGEMTVSPAGPAPATIRFSATNSTSVYVTGATSTGASRETYGGQTISLVPVPAGVYTATAAAPSW